MLTPAMRAIFLLALPLLVSRVLADHEDPAVAADYLALLAHRLDRRSYLHDPFRSDDPDGEALETGAAAATIPRSGLLHADGPLDLSATGKYSAVFGVGLRSGNGDLLFCGPLTQGGARPVKPPVRPLILAAVMAVLLVPALASAAPEMSAGGSFSFLRGDDEFNEISNFAIAPAPTGGGVWVSGSVVRQVGSTPEDATYQTFPLIRRFSADGTLEQTFEYSPQNRVFNDLDISPDGNVLYAASYAPGQSLGIERISTATGAILGSFATPGEAGPGQL